MNEKVKKVLGLIVLKGAFSSRNLTSIGLVALFFGVYVASGGKIAAIPKVKNASQFGTASSSQASTEYQREKVVEQSRSSLRRDGQVKSLFPSAEEEESAAEEIENTQINKKTARDGSRLDSIEERLNRLSQ